MSRPSIRSLAGGAAGIAAGVLGGIALTSVAAGPVASEPARQLLDAAHVPPALTLPGEPIRLRYAIVCAVRQDARPCDGSGEVFVRSGQTGPFRALTLHRGEDSVEGRYFVDLPREVASAREGFSYYAVLRDDTSGETLTVPSGGALAPQRSRPLLNAVRVDLGRHEFGRTRVRDARVVSAPWGAGRGEAGLEGSRELGFVGPSAFDVARDGAVTLLDQVNRRLQRWLGGEPTTTTPVSVSGGLADFAVEPDGTVDVLEPPTRVTGASVLRRFDRDGLLTFAQRLSDRTWSKLILGPGGPVVQQVPSEQWLPVAAGGAALDRAGQARAGTTGRPLPQGRELVVARVGAGELRVAEVAGHAIVRAWRITSATPLGEVQLAEQLGKRFVVVLKIYTEAQDEFVAVVVDDRGLVERFSLDATGWAEAAPLARFRLVGGSLFQLGSTPAGVFVDRFDLEVIR
jgi:hypothetical protein